jgi:HD-GYP domain-containing protein (c-di-GMP phosphodiesterase class II)
MNEQTLNEALRSSPVHPATLEALTQALDFRDRSTSGHSRRVAELTAGVAGLHGIEGEALAQIHHGALLHDIGKLRIPDSILWKPSQLDADEWKTMRLHPEYGYEFLRNVESLRGAADLVYSHHEKFDGSGYPRRLDGENIPFGARIFAIVDAVDAMIYKRPYNTPITFQQAAEEVRRCSGKHFDPRIVTSTLEFLSARVPLSAPASGRA